MFRVNGLMKHFRWNIKLRAIFLLMLTHSTSPLIGAYFSNKKRTVNISRYEGHRYAFEIHQYT